MDDFYELEDFRLHFNVNFSRLFRRGNFQRLLAKLHQIKRGRQSGMTMRDFKTVLNRLRSL